jgi:DNA-binding beta-propeller fold protein YncE
MAYDKAQNQLILTCKGATSDPFKRSFYGFDLTTKKCSEVPLFDISLTQVQDFLKKTNANQDDFDKYLDAAPSEFHFGPSGIAVHPITGEWYIVSSVGKVLMVVSRKGDILNMIKLDKKIHPQPEGITFDSDGTLYISDEGKNEAIPQIHRFVWNAMTNK